MILKTKHKMLIAGLAYRPVRFLRRIFGRPSRDTFRRSGFQWELDLGEVVDFMIYISGNFERDVRKFIQRNVKEGDVAFDIGANVGAHSLFMGRCVGQTGHAYAVEATEYAYNKLKRNLSLNPDVDACIEAFHCMLVAELPEGNSSEAQIEIHSSWPFDSSDERHPQHQGTLKSIGDAEQTTLDTLTERHDIKRLDYLKLDVDGNEWDVLTGGRMTIDRFKPIIAMEVALDYNEEDHKKSFSNIHQILTDLGYVFYDYTGRELPPTFDGIAKMVPAGASLNAICVVPGTKEPVFG